MTKKEKLNINRRVFKIKKGSSTSDDPIKLIFGKRNPHITEFSKTPYQPEVLSTYREPFKLAIDYTNKKYSGRKIVFSRNEFLDTLVATGLVLVGLSVIIGGAIYGVPGVKEKLGRAVDYVEKSSLSATFWRDRKEAEKAGYERCPELFNCYDSEKIYGERQK